MVRSAFGLVLSENDDENIRDFMNQGYSFVICKEDLVVGLILAFLKPNLNGKELFIDTLVIEENLRGKGLGKKLLKYVFKKASDNDIYLARLQTDKMIDAYRIYEHLGFWESQMVQMRKHLFYERWQEDE